MKSHFPRLWKSLQKHNNLSQQEGACDQVLSEYLEGFGKGSNKRYGRIEDKPDHWPDTIGWVGFKGSSHVKLESCIEIIQSFLEGRQVDFNSYHLTDVSEAEDIKDNTTESTETTETTEMENNDLLTLDESGKWYWGSHTNQWFPFTLDDTGNWFWKYEKQKWFPYTSPVISRQDDDNTPEQQSKEKQRQEEEEEDGQDQLNILIL